MENLEALQWNLDQAVDQGMVDIDNAYHNEILDLMDDGAIVESWPELAEIVSRAKILEIDIDAWLSYKGITTIGLQWPQLPSLQ